jgi:hypothetical protein
MQSTTPIIKMNNKPFAKKVSGPKIHSITISDPESGPKLKLNGLLGRLHKSVLAKPGKIRAECRGLECFPPNTPEGTRMAKELGEKWSDSFYNGRKYPDGTPKHDFKDAGLWTKFFFDLENQVIKITVEPVKSGLVQPTEPVDPVEPVDPDGLVEPTCVSVPAWAPGPGGWVSVPAPPPAWVPGPHGWIPVLPPGWVQTPQGLFFSQQ